MLLECLQGSWELQDAGLLSSLSVTSGPADVSHVVSVSTNTPHCSAPNTEILSHRVSGMTKHHIYISNLFQHQKLTGRVGGQVPVIFFSPSQEPGASRDRANPGPEPRPEPEPLRHKTLTRPPSRHCGSLRPREYSSQQSVFTESWDQTRARRSHREIGNITLNTVNSHVRRSVWVEVLVSPANFWWRKNWIFKENLEIKGKFT